ncbi:S-acyl fatty acid synthase thioesterase, medium chain [Lonchura striata]|uniref:oleoyl-[acyl-carrier-protein] hydrolase n=2 Tax=Lonchura striata TaxID=40157 RepID=A0A218V0Z6_9PASE|nr:S-acyl fatty acid synthase thioesterase, medium chain [Lonchura striata domestica]
MSAAHAPNSAAHLAIKSMVLPDGNNDLLAIMKILGGNFEYPPDEDSWSDMVLTFREDVRILQTSSFEKTDMNTPFSCDITYFSGSDDKIFDTKGWQELTSGDTSFYELPGGHLYLLKPSNESFLIKHITRTIENANQ